MKIQKWLSISLGIIVVISSILFTAYLKQRRRDRAKESISEIFYKEKEVKWVQNSFYGLIFESPNSGLDQKNEITDLKFPGVKTAKLNYLVTGDLLYSVFYMDLESKRYDFEKGMEGILSNLVQKMNGSELEFEFKYGESWLPYGLAEGEFKIDSKPILLKAFLSFHNTSKKKNNLRSLVIIGTKTNQNTGIIQRSIESIDLNYLKNERNPLVKYLDKDFPLKNFDPNDTIPEIDKEERLRRLRQLRESTREKKEFQVPYKYRE